MRSKKYLMYGILVVLVISIGVSYSYFVSKVENKNGKLSINSKEINIIFTDTTEISEESITPGWCISKSFSVENKSNGVFNYNIVLEDLINTFETVGNLQYKITSTNGYNMTEYADIPKSKESKDVILVYDIDIEKGVKQEYTIEFIYKNSTEDQSIDMNKELSGVLAITEGSIDPSIFYSVEVNLENGTITSENPQESLKKGSITYTYELNEGYEINGTEVICSGSAKGEITEDNIIIRNIREDQVCTISPSKKKYTLNVGTNDVNMGTVSPSSLIIEHGGSTNITINPKTGYRYVSNTCGGIVSGNTMTISNIKASKSCTVTFESLPKFYDKLLADNPNKLKYEKYGTMLNDDNIGKMYIANGNQTEDGSNVYYFAGNALNNWVKFGQDSNGSDLYWRIIRTNEDRSVRLLYVGTSMASTASYLTGSFNRSYTHFSAIGYMYGLFENNDSQASLCRTVDCIRKYYISSTAKLIIDSWYENSINKKVDYNNFTYDKYVSRTAIYCNDRTYDPSIDNGVPLLESTNIFYGSSFRETNPSYKCGSTGSGLSSTANIADKFSVNTSKGGNGKLTYPVAMITADEIMFAAGRTAGTNKGWYQLNSNGSSVTSGKLEWYTMSPSYYYGRYDRGGGYIFSIKTDGSLTNKGGIYSTVGAIRPVLSLKSCVKWKSGNGSSSTPYEVYIDSKCASAEN